MPTPAKRDTTRTVLITPRHCLLAALLFFVMMVGIGAMPGNAEAASEVVYDKLLHFMAYALLTGLLYLGLSGRPLSRAWRTLLAAGLLGALDEALQALMPYRHANWLDWKFDMIAALSCVALLILLSPLYAKTGSKAEPEAMRTRQPGLID